MNIFNYNTTTACLINRAMAGILVTIGLQACNCASVICCSACGTVKHARSFYLGIFTAASIVGAIFLSPAIGEDLEKMAKITGTITGCNATLCAQEWSRLGAHRVMSATSTFFALLAVLTIGVKQTSDCRLCLHTGAWGFKAVILVGLSVVSFWVPNVFYDSIWPVFVQFGALAFSVTQALLLVRMSHALSACINARVDRGSSGFKALAVAITVVTAALTLAGCAYLFKLHGPQSGPCVEDGGPPRWVVATVNLVLICASIGVSGLESVRARVSYSGQLQVSIISLQMTSLAWLSLRIDSTSNCEPSDAGIVGISVAAFMLAVCLIYSTVRTRRQTSFMLLRDDYEVDQWTVAEGGFFLDPKIVSLPYDASFFHLTLALAALRVTTLLSDALPSAHLTLKETAMTNWMQALSSWLTFAFYMWSLMFKSSTD